MRRSHWQLPNRAAADGEELPVGGSRPALQAVLSSMRRFHTLFFATLCGGFVLVGGWKLCTSLKPELPSIGDASFSSDRDIEGLCGIDHGSERIRQTLAALPSKK